MCLSFFKRYENGIYVVFRLFVGFLFFSHGVQKLFGVWGAEQAAAMFSLMWFAGVIEFFGGLGIFFGVFTRLAALGSALQMVAAYFIAHISNGLLPIVNRGELALLYFASFLILLVHGAGKWSFEKVLWKKEIF